MKKGTFLLLLTIVLMAQVFGQGRQRPCNKYPTKEQLKVKLKSGQGHSISPYDFSGRCNTDESTKTILLDLLQAKPLTASERAPHQKAGVIRTIGLLDMKSAIPVLEKALTDTAYAANRYDIQLALARLGNRGLQEQFIKEGAYDPALNDEEWVDALSKRAGVLAYIGSQESIFALHNWLDSSKQYVYLSNGTLAKSAYKVIALLGDIVMNPDFQQKLKGADLSGYQGSNAFIEDCKRWLIANKGKYVINREVYLL